MGWFNVFGLIFVAVILVPNLIFAVKCKDGFEKKWHNSFVEAVEQIGRFRIHAFQHSGHLVRLVV